MVRIRGERRGSMGGVAKGVALALAVGAAAATVSSWAPDQADPAPLPPAASAASERGDPASSRPTPSESAPSARDASGPASWYPEQAESAPAVPENTDPGVRAFVLAYGPLIDSVTYHAHDVVFHLGRTPIHFQDGRLLAADRLDRRSECDPIFYRYSLEPLTVPPPAPDELPTYCTDVLESLWGRTEGQIREHGRAVRFLDHRMFVNHRLVGPLAAVERDILKAASHDSAVAAWIDELDVTYSFMNREIAGSPTRSHHAWGLAIDLVPISYEGRDAYWRWSRVLEGGDWDRIPMEQRWSPPQRVVAVFERHGFVWGGKWPLFDMIHFEYRPEILLYNRMLSSGGR